LQRQLAVLNRATQSLHFTGLAQLQQRLVSAALEGDAGASRCVEMLVPPSEQAKIDIIAGINNQLAAIVNADRRGRGLPSGEPFKLSKEASLKQQAILEGVAGPARASGRLATQYAALLNASPYRLSLAAAEKANTMVEMDENWAQSRKKARPLHGNSISAKAKEFLSTVAHSDDFSRVDNSTTSRPKTVATGVDKQNRTVYTKHACRNLHHTEREMLRAMRSDPTIAAHYFGLTGKVISARQVKGCRRCPCFIEAKVDQCSSKHQVQHSKNKAGFSQNIMKCLRNGQVCAMCPEGANDGQKRCKHMTWADGYGAGIAALCCPPEVVPGVGINQICPKTGKELLGTEVQLLLVRPECANSTCPKCGFKNLFKGAEVRTASNENFTAKGLKLGDPDQVKPPVQFCSCFRF
jgi:hypothetical protein